MDPEDDPTFLAVLQRAVRLSGWMLPETPEEVAAMERELSFHSGYTVELDDGGRAIVSHYGDGDGLRTAIRFHPPEAVLSPRDIAVLLGGLLTFAFDRRPTHWGSQLDAIDPVTRLERVNDRLDNEAEKDRIERDVRDVILGEPEPTNEPDPTSR